MDRPITSNPGQTSERDNLISAITKVTCRLTEINMGVSKDDHEWSAELKQWIDELEKKKTTILNAAGTW
jgi:hypothetical protein